MNVSLNQLLLNETEAEERAAQRYDTLNMQLEQIIAKLNDPMNSNPSNRAIGNAETGTSLKSQEILAVEFHEASLKCTTSCACSCHRRTKLKLLSTLFIGYTGSVLRKNDCYKYGCSTTRPAFEGSFTYYFPLWFVQKSLTISMRISRLGDPSLAITAHHVLPRYSEPFLAVERGDASTLLELLKSGKLHPNSVEMGYGYTLLQVSH